MKLWLDDIRQAPEGWAHAKSADEAIRLLKTGTVTEASLDHDVIWTWNDTENWMDTQTGYAVVAWMAKNNAWPRDGVAVHSANRDGAARMKSLVKTGGGRLIEPWL